MRYLFAFRFFFTSLVLAVYFYVFLLLSERMLEIDSAHAAFTQDNIAGTAVVDFDGSLAGVWTMSWGQAKWNSSEGTIQQISANTGSVTLAPITPASLDAWDTIELTLFTGDISHVRVDVLSCTGSTTLASDLQPDASGVVDIATIPSSIDCIQPVISMGPPDQYDRAYQFDGVNDYVDLTSMGFLSGNMVFSFWMNPDDITPGKMLWGTDTGNTSNKFVAHRDGYFSYWNGGGRVSTNVYVPANTRTHIAILFDYPNVSFFKDGIFQETLGMGSSDYISDIHIADNYIDTYGEYFDGGFYDRRFYTGSKTTGEILHIANGGVDMTHLLARYQMNEGSGTQSIDASGNGYTGTLYNGVQHTVYNIPGHPPVTLDAVTTRRSPRSLIELDMDSVRMVDSCDTQAYELAYSVSHLGDQDVIIHVPLPSLRPGTYNPAYGLDTTPEVTQVLNDGQYTATGTSINTSYGTVTIPAQSVYRHMPSVNAGESGILKWRMRMPCGLQDNTQYDMTAYVQSALAPDADIDQLITMETQALPSLAKTSDAMQLGIGYYVETSYNPFVNYTLTLENSRNATQAAFGLTGASLVDDLSDIASHIATVCTGASFADRISSPSGTFDATAQTISWTGSDLPTALLPGETYSYTYTVDYSDCDLTGETVDNTATRSPVGVSSVDASHTIQGLDSIDPTGMFSKSISSYGRTSDQVTMGDTFWYMLSFSNIGFTRLGDVVAFDKLPDDIELMGPPSVPAGTQIRYMTTGSTYNATTPPPYNTSYTGSGSFGTGWSSSYSSQTQWIAVYIPCLHSSFFPGSSIACSNTNMTYQHVQFPVRYSSTQSCETTTRENLGVFTFHSASDSLTNTDADMRTITSPVFAVANPVQATIVPDTPQLDVTSTHLSGRNSMQADEVLELSLFVHNAGTAMASSAQAQIDIPSILKNGAIDYPSVQVVDAGGGSVNYQLPSGLQVERTNLLPGETKEVRLRFNHFQGVLDGETAVTNAVVSLEDDSCDTVNQTVSHTLVIDATPMLQSHKTTDRVAILSGEQIEYTLHVLNQGNGSAEDAYIVDRLPDGTSMVDVRTMGASRTGSPFSCADCVVYFAQDNPSLPDPLSVTDSVLYTDIADYFVQGTQSGGMRSSPIANPRYVAVHLRNSYDLLPAGELMRVGIRVQDVSHQLGDVIENRAAIFSASTPQTITNQVQTSIGERPGLALETSVDDSTVQACQAIQRQVDYLVDGTNNDTSMLQLTIPSSFSVLDVEHERNVYTLSLSGASLSTGATSLLSGSEYTYQSMGGQQSMYIDLDSLRGQSLQALEGGIVTLALQVDCAASTTDVFQLSAVGSYTNAQIASSTQVVSDLYVANADVVIIKNADILDPLPGDTVRYTIQVFNQGTNQAEDIAIVDNVPMGMCYMSGSTQSITNDFTISEPYITGASCAGASLARDSLYTTSFVGPGGTGYLDAMSSSFFYTYDVSVDSSVGQGVDLLNTIQVSTSTAEDDYANNMDEDIIATPYPDIHVQTQGPASVQAGDTYTYTIRTRNTSKACASDTVLVHRISDVLPVSSPDGRVDISLASLLSNTGSIYVYTGMAGAGSGWTPSFSSTSPLSGGWSAWAGGGLSDVVAVAVDYGTLCQSDGIHELTLTAQAQDPITGIDTPLGTVLSNFSFIQTSSDEQELDNNQDFYDIVVPGVDLQAGIQASSEGALPGTLPGEIQNYTVQVHNTSAEAVCAVRGVLQIRNVSDGWTPQGVTPWSISSVSLINGVGGTAAPINTGGVVWSAGAAERAIQYSASISGDTYTLAIDFGTPYEQLCFPADTSLEIQIQGQIPSTAPDGQLVEAEWYVWEESDDLEMDMSNNTAQSSTVVRRSDVFVHKEGVSQALQSEDRTELGDIIEYTISYNNLGSAIAQDTVITEQIPDGACINVDMLEQGLPTGVTVQYFTDGSVQLASIPTGIDCSIARVDVHMGDLPGPASVVGESVGNFAGVGTTGVVDVVSGLVLETYVIEEVPLSPSVVSHRGYNVETTIINGELYAVISSYASAGITYIYRRDDNVDQFQEVIIPGYSGAIWGVDIAIEEIDGAATILVANTIGRNEAFRRDNTIEEFVELSPVGVISSRPSRGVEVIFLGSEVYASFSSRSSQPNQLRKRNSVLENFEEIPLPVGSQSLTHTSVDSISIGSSGFFTFSPVCRSTGWPEVWGYSSGSSLFTVQSFSGSLPSNPVGRCRTSLFDVDGNIYLLRGIDGDRDVLYRYDTTTNIFVPVLLGQGTFPSDEWTSAISDVRTADNGSKYILVFNRSENYPDNIWRWNAVSETFDFVATIGSTGNRNWYKQNSYDLEGLKLFTNPQYDIGNFYYEIHVYNQEYDSFETIDHVFSGGGISTERDMSLYSGDLIGIANNYGDSFVGTRISPVYTGTYRQTMQTSTGGFLGWDELRVDLDVPQGDEVYVTIYPDTNYTSGAQLIGPVDIRSGMLDLSPLPVDAQLGIEFSFVTDDLTDAPVIRERQASYRSDRHPSFPVQIHVDSDANAMANIDAIMNRVTIDTPAPEIDLSNQDSQTRHVLPRHDLVMDKQVDRTVALSGDILTYTLEYINNGPAHASGVQIQDVFPAYFVPTSFSLTPDQWSGGNAIWHIGSVQPGQTGSIVLSGTIACNALDCPSSGDILTNIAVITAQTLESDPGNNQGQAETVIGSYPDLAVELDCLKTNQLGSVFTCTVMYENTGNTPASGNVLEIFLDPYQEYMTGSGVGMSDCVYADNRTILSGMTVSGSHMLSCSGGVFDTILPGASAWLSVDMYTQDVMDLVTIPSYSIWGSGVSMQAQIQSTSPEVLLENNESLQEISLYPGATELQGYVYREQGIDNVYTPGMDIGRSGVRVCLEGMAARGSGVSVGQSGDIVVPCQVTDAQGYFAFIDVPIGSYTVIQDTSVPDMLYSSAGSVSGTIRGSGSTQSASVLVDRIENIELVSGEVSENNFFASEAVTCFNPVNLSLGISLSSVSVGQTVQGSVTNNAVQITVNGVSLAVASDGSFSFTVPQESSVNVQAYNSNDICTETISFSPFGVQSSGGSGRGPDDCPCGDYSPSTRDLRCVADGEREGAYEDLYCQSQQDQEEQEEDREQEDDTGQGVDDEDEPLGATSTHESAPRMPAGLPMTGPGWELLME